MRIQQLPPAVANQIAAGEVIERPASVVKELLENALDAEASFINIEIGHGGLNQIKISDDGVGIIADDLPLAIAAHATSKISQLTDLYSISSMGFRGEALASIASISRLTISSKSVGQAHAMMLAMEGGSYHLKPCARSQGTTIDVRDIFFNAPVRKKFLKTACREFQAIEMVVKRFALSAPALTIHLSHNGKPHFTLPAAICDKTRLLRIRKLLGKAFIEQANYLDAQIAGMRLQGYISLKEYQRSQNDKQWVYVNRRMVKDKLLNHAIKQAYENVLHPGRHPACLLYLTLNSDEVDVNVHPTKHELRFQQPRLIHDFIHSQIQKSLHLPQKEVNYTIESREKAIFLQVHEPYLPPALIKQKLDVPGDVKSWLALNASFALLFLHEEPYIVDVRALQCDWLMATLKDQKLPLSSRPLLIPLSFPLRSNYLENSEAYRQILCRFGIEADLLSNSTIIVRSLPVAIPHLDLRRFIASLFEAPIPTEAQLLELLILCQTFDIKHSRQEETLDLISYIQTLSAEQLKPLGKHVSVETCRDLLNA